jgi:3-hydroxybenzoate 6-monooxygenase
MHPPGRIPVLIIGGGIGRLATALAVARTGRRVHVLERSPEFAELGAGLQLAPNASRVLDQVGILEEVHKQAFFPRRLLMMDMVAGVEITSLALDQKFLDRYRYPYFVVHRGDLLNIEVEACRAAGDRITLESNKGAVSIEDLGDGARVHCADGSLYECDMLVGADGLWSLTRKTVHDDGEPICAEHVAYRGVIPMQDMPWHPGLDSMTIWIGPEKHFVQYPLRRGEICNQVAVFRSYRYRSGSEDWGSAEELDEHFAEACDYVRRALMLMERGRHWAMHDRLPIPDWTRNHITLLGDAAHPMLQYLAQGACQALEDSVCLADSLARHASDVPGALRAYQEARSPRTARVQREARAFGELLHAANAGGNIRKALAAHADNEFFYFDWFYGA